MVEIEKLKKFKEALISFAQKKVSSILYNEKFKFQLMLLEATDFDLIKYNSYISAVWIDDVNSFELKKAFFEFLRRETTEDVYLIVRAIIFVHTTDNTVKYFSNLYNFNNQEIVFMPSLQIGENSIENAYLFNTHILENQHA